MRVTLPNASCLVIDCGAEVLTSGTLYGPAKHRYGFLNAANSGYVLSCERITTAVPYAKISCI